MTHTHTHTKVVKALKCLLFQISFSLTPVPCLRSLSWVEGGLANPRLRCCFHQDAVPSLPQNKVTPAEGVLFLYHLSTCPILKTCQPKLLSWWRLLHTSYWFSYFIGPCWQWWIHAPAGVQKPSSRGQAIESSWISEQQDQAWWTGLFLVNLLHALS